VVSLAAPSGWGGQIIPRVGMEVMVAFIDGDPDRPLVVGAVPNPANRVPYDLPLNKTKSVFRTQTHKGNGFNEISFEDDLGHEEIFIHAQRDKLELVSNRSFEIVGEGYDGIISGIRSMSSLSLNPALQKEMKALLEHALEASRERNKTRR
jgi:type VI secretion system secreted protein VgrG